MGGSNSVIHLDSLNLTVNSTINLNEYKCSDRGLILPIINEYTWPIWIRAIIYFVGLLYLFMGIADIADKFMDAINVITSQERTDPNDDSKKVKIWDETVACLTLMALGSSSPEILLSVIEIVGNNFKAGDLGPGTIVGSAAYNLLFISAVCVYVVSEDGARIKDFKVFITTTIYSIFAYIWLYIVLVLWTPDEVTIWEAFITLFTFPLLVVNSYLVKKNFFIPACSSEDEEQEENEEDPEKMNFLDRKALYENNPVNGREALKFFKLIRRHKDLTEEDTAKLMAAVIINSRKKTAIDFYREGTKALTGSGENKMKLEPRLEKIFNNIVDLTEEEEDQNDNTENSTNSIIRFECSSYVVSEDEKTCRVKVIRKGNTNQEVAIRITSLDGTAKSGEDFKHVDEVLVMQSGKSSVEKLIEISDDDQGEQDEKFFLKIKLVNEQDGVAIDKQNSICVITIIDNDRVAEAVNTELETFDELKKSWGNQFRQAMNVKNGDIESATFIDYILHFIALPWKIAFAFVPPSYLLGGWLSFCISLIIIGIMTAIVGDAAAIFGCLVGLKDSVTAITFVALGTSLPDTFASAIAARKEKTADNAIGNITGSNSVNVFLGLGLPWVIASIYWKFQGQPFVVKAGSLSFSIAVYTTVSIIAFTVLFLRRFIPFLGKAELGGPSIPKYATSALFILLWIIYIVLSSIQAYDHLPF